MGMPIWCPWAPDQVMGMPVGTVFFELARHPRWDPYTLLSRILVWLTPEKLQSSIRPTVWTRSEIQIKTFTNWANSKLTDKRLPPIGNITTDVSTGEPLIQLLEVIGEESLGRYNKNPKLRIQKVENCNKVLQFIKSRNIQLTNIGAEDIVDQNSKLILGLIWSLILRFSIADISEEGLTAKEGLLLWCQRKTAPYKPTVDVKDFTFSWNDGLALCALIHRHRPELLDFYALDTKKKTENAALAMEVAERDLGIPKLFAPEDLTEVVKPDERSVMTYVAQYFHAFAGSDKLETAQRRVGKFAEVMEQAWMMQNDFEERARALMKAIADQVSAWSSSSFSSYSDAMAQLNEFETNHKLGQKRSWVVEKRDLDTLLGNIATKLKTYNLAAYAPPAGCTPADIDSSWQDLLAAESKRKSGITAYIAEARDRLRKKYADAANALARDIEGLSRDLASLDPEMSLEKQLEAVKGLQAKLGSLNGPLKNVEALYNETREAGSIADNVYTIYSPDDLAFDLEQLGIGAGKKASFIQNQMVARTRTDIAPGKLEEYSNAFRQLDRDNSNSLNRLEFKAALQAMGIVYSDEEFEKVFHDASKGTEEVTFEPYIGFVRSIEEDQTTPEQLLGAFKAVAGERNFITADDLVRAGIKPAVAQKLAGGMPQVSGGSDYSAYLGQAFSPAP
ncbi:calponin homology domain-containing protein [Hyaloraphidium curvatum]|nr:calponin homology domain-containing protein [Hyaloraphidium curvatum]